MERGIFYVSKLTLCAAMQWVFDMFWRFLEKGNCQIIPMSSLLVYYQCDVLIWNLERLNDIQIIELVVLKKKPHNLMVLLQFVPKWIATNGYIHTGIRS
jgi:hypothetical protein